MTTFTNFYPEDCFRENNGKEGVFQMIVKDLVETRELLAEVTREDIYIVYERFENADCHCEGERVEEIECDPEEIVQILTAHPNDSLSLTSIKKYQIGVEYEDLAEVLKDIRRNFSYLLEEEKVLQPLG
ncbi:hypothetical protein [Evansella clarkii]|uniref:hypothetical protein n=1 Tax=Evansella clarkii TaxID=79879 RepID=UPI000996DBFB|nr:hypothetical protein [Evansella clarkii]